MITSFSRTDFLAILANVALAVQSTAYGLQYRIPPEQIFIYFATASTIFFAIGGMILLTAVRNATRSPDKSGTSEWVGAAMTIAAISQTIFFNSAALPVSWVALVLAVPLVYLALRGFSDPRIGAFWLLAAGVIIIVYLAFVIPIDVKAANMLVSVKAACVDITAGLNPYTQPHPDIASVPFYYLPANYLPYCPLIWTDLDPRVLNVSIFALLLLILASALGFMRHPAPMTLVAMPILFSPMAAQMAYYGHIWTYWLLVALLFLGIATHRENLSAVTLAAALATRQTAAFLVIPVAAIFFRMLDRRSFFISCAMVTILYLALVSPALVWVENPLHYFYLGVASSSGDKHLLSGNPFDQIALSGILTQIGARNLLPVLQVLTTCATGAYLYLRRPSPPAALVLLGITFILIIGLNPFLSRYLYGPGYLALAVGIGFAAQGSDTTSLLGGRPVPSNGRVNSDTRTNS